LARKKRGNSAPTSQRTEKQGTKKKRKKILTFEKEEEKKKKAAIRLENLESAKEIGAGRRRGMLSRIKGMRRGGKKLTFWGGPWPMVEP